jgi:2-C-methyl-D-erythritol 4-phosphate cytidylyltransferase
MTAPQALALIPAAGFGTRFHEGGPKALVPLVGKPLLLHVLERLARSGRVTSAVIAGPGGLEDAFHAALKASPVSYVLVEGGVTRKDSVTKALNASEAADESLVLVHDAARPLVDPAEVAAVVDAAAETGAAVAGFALVDTIKRVHGGKIVETVPRSDLFAATTPQVFRAKLLKKALAKEGSREVTDDAELVERSGAPVAIVLTSRWNLKITYPEDLAWAEAFLSQNPLA